MSSINLSTNCTSITELPPTDRPFPMTGIARITGGKQTSGQPPLDTAPWFTVRGGAFQGKTNHPMFVQPAFSS